MNRQKLSDDLAYAKDSINELKRAYCDIEVIRIRMKSEIERLERFYEQTMGKLSEGAYD